MGKTVEEFGLGAINVKYLIEWLKVSLCLVDWLAHQWVRTTIMVQRNEDDIARQSQCGINMKYPA